MTEGKAIQNPFSLQSTFTLLNDRSFSSLLQRLREEGLRIKFTIKLNPLKVRLRFCFILPSNKRFQSNSGFSSKNHHPHRPTSDL